MTTFTFPIAFYGTATIEGDIADEARNTIGIDLRNALAEECSADLDNGGKLTIKGFEVGSIQAETFAMIELIRWLATGEHTPDSMDRAINDSTAILARLNAIAPDADLAEAAGDDLCLACERPSLDCSRAPCAAVIADREA